jgi:Holliday junction DNA helicase RuvA
MIGYLSGTVKWLDGNSVILDVNGVGYEALCSSNTIGDLGEGAKTALWIYTHVREDALQLFGFSSQVEKRLFENLLKVNGIGPKMAVQILSGAPLDRLIDFIEQQDVKALTQLPKVGKKIAEQMILTLKGKLVVDSAGTGKSPSDELASALANLGFKPYDIQEVVKGIDRKKPFEDQLRKALSTLGGQR